MPQPFYGGALPPEQRHSYPSQNSEEMYHEEMYHPYTGPTVHGSRQTNGLFPFLGNVFSTIFGPGHQQQFQPPEPHFHPGGTHGPVTPGPVGPIIGPVAPGPGPVTPGPIGPGGAHPPTSPPPSFIPQQPLNQQVGVMAVDPGGIRRCLFRFTYIWLTFGQQFWFYPVFLGPRSIAGFRWTGFNWVYFGIDLRHIAAFQCN
jgi:hypothetical protein